MNREEAKELFRSDKDAYGKPHHIMKNIDKIYDDFEKEHHLPPAEGAEDIRQLLLGWEHYKRDHLRESEALDVEAILLSEYSQIAAQPQPTAEGTGKTCHAKEMEYNHNMCAMQESCEKCEAYKVPTNEGDIAKTETDTGRIVDMPSLSLPPAEGAEAIVKKYEDEYDFKFHWVQRDRVIRMMREFAAQRQPTSEGAEEIDNETIAWAAEHQCGTPFSERWIGFVKGAKWHRSLHAQRIAEKMKEANQFILDIAGVLGIETDGVGFDGLTLSIDDFKEAADKMVSERLREELIRYIKWYGGFNYENMTDEMLVNEYLKTRDSHESV